MNLSTASKQQKMTTKNIHNEIYITTTLQYYYNNKVADEWKDGSWHINT